MKTTITDLRPPKFDLKPAIVFRKLHQLQTRFQKSIWIFFFKFLKAKKSEETSVQKLKRKSKAALEKNKRNEGRRRNHVSRGIEETKAIKEEDKFNWKMCSQTRSGFRRVFANFLENDERERGRIRI
uniref:Uncharacterized protein n=1 Tax=Noccaea caerulescens TaxID=107243 RepID=A0A1J3J7G1_NOCCA